MVFSLRLLGGVSIEGPTGPVAGYTSQPRQLALLALLAVAGRPGVSRDRILSCLWPESSTDSARHSLADAVYRLRRELGQDSIEGHSTTLRLNPRVVHTDLFEFREALDAGDLAKAVEVNHGPFMDGFHLRDASAFEQWRDAEADRLDHALRTALERLADSEQAGGDPAAAMDRYRRLLALDPYNSRAVLRLMEAQAAAGDPAGAVNLAAEHTKRLAEEMGVEPPEELLSLAERLRHTGAREVRPVGATRPFPFAGQPGASMFALPAGFVGRAKELARLHACLDGVLAGGGRVVLITGEAGTGKTSLAAEFCRQAMERVPDLVVAAGNGNAHTGIGDPYLPFREILDLLSGGIEARYSAGSVSREQAIRLWALLPHTARVLATKAPALLDTFVSRSELVARIGTTAGNPEVLSIVTALRRPELDVLAGSPQAAFFDQYVRLVEELSRRAPMVLVLDDLQWADSGSIGLLFQLGRQLRGYRVLVLGLFRPSDVAMGRNHARHPLEPVVNELRGEFGEVEIALAETGDRAFVDAMVDAEPNALDEEFREKLWRRTRGHAFFTSELLKVMRDTGMLVRKEDGWHATRALEWSLLPVRVQAMLAERIGRLPSELHRILAVASVEGETFTLEAVAVVTGRTTADLLRIMSHELGKRFRLVVAHGTTRLNGRSISEFRFRHILFQRWLYDGLDAVERTHLHERVGRALEVVYGDRRTTIAVRLGRHFREAAIADKAAMYLTLAGHHAEYAGVFPEAVTHFEAALEELLKLPPGRKRDRREVEIQAGLGIARVFSAAPGQVPPLERARALAETLDDDRELFRAVTGLYIARAHYPSDNRLGRELSLEALTVARRTGDRALLAGAHTCVALNAGMRGDFEAALLHSETVARLYEHASRVPWLEAFMSPGPTAQCLAAEALCMLGYPDQARGRAAAALRDAGSAGGTGTQLLVFWYRAMVLLWLRDYEELSAHCGAMTASIHEHGLEAHYGPLARIPFGWCRAQMGQVEEGIAIVRSAFADWIATGWAAGAGYFAALASEVMGLGGRADEGLELLQRTVADSTSIDEQWQEPEIRRIRGDLLLAGSHSDPAGAERAYTGAIDLARRQHARWPELRASTHFARLLRAQHRDPEVRPMLADICSWFEEGSDTPDLEEARHLLHQLN